MVKDMYTNFTNKWVFLLFFFFIGYNHEGIIFQEIREIERIGEEGR